MLLLSGLGWGVKVGEAKSPCAEASWLAGAFTTLIAPSLTVSRTGPEAALMAVGSLGCALPTRDESHLKRYFSCLTVMR